MNSPSRTEDSTVPLNLPTSTISMASDSQKVRNAAILPAPSVR